MKKLLSAVAIALASITSAQAAEETYVPPVQPSLTRAEVTNDLAAWHASGLAAASRGENTPDIYSSKYRHMFATYQHLAQQRLAANGAATK